MNSHELTDLVGAAKLPNMEGNRRRHGTKRMVAGGLVPLALGGCITVNAPEEPIVIELNVNIRQEVIYRLAQDAGNTIEENADIF
jgi:hypothetical protein